VAVTVRGWVVVRAILLGMVLVLSLVGCAGKQVCRKADVYMAENQAFRRFIREPTNTTKRFIQDYCSCTTGVSGNAWIDKVTGENSQLCEEAAKTVQVLEARAFAHLDFSLYVVGLLDQKPDLHKIVPPDYLLCPNFSSILLHGEATYYAHRGVE